MNKTFTLISCPSCKHEFQPEEAIENKLRIALDEEFKNKQVQLESELDKKYQLQIDERKKQLELELKKKSQDTISALQQQIKTLLEKGEQEKADFKSQLQSLQDEKKILEESKKEMAQHKETLAAKERDLENKLAQGKASYEAEIRERMLAEHNRYKQELELEKERSKNAFLNELNAKVEEINRQRDMQVRELQKKLDDQGELVEEMKRKHSQGSMQLQGEIGELVIEEALIKDFPFDKIEPVAKGLNGADTIQIVMNQSRVECGKIIYESKRTKHFAYEWIDKLKNDMRNSGCDVAVLVTEALPKELNRWGFMDGIWICTFHEFRAVALCIRQGLIRTGDLMLSQENKGSKMQQLYDFLTGNQFRGYIEGLIEINASRRESRELEKRVTMKRWAKDDKESERELNIISSMYGSIQGISGSAMPEIKGLEYDEKYLLEE